MDVKGKVVIVTGGGNGIGQVYSEHLARAGASVVVADIDGEAAGRVAAGLRDEGAPGPALAVASDVTSPADAAAMVEAALDEFGRVDVLVNNAGTYPHTAFAEITLDEWRRVIAVNLDSVFLCSRAVMAPMYDQRAGKIVNVATNLVWVGLTGMSHYIAAKAGVVGFTRALAREVGEFGVTVNALAPGPVVPEGRLSSVGEDRLAAIVDYQCVKRPQQPEDLVGMLMYLCSSASDFVSGQVFTVDGGLTTH